MTCCDIMTLKIPIIAGLIDSSTLTNTHLIIYYILFRTLNSTVSVLDIPSVSEDDVGMFECQVTTCHNGEYTTSVNITFMGESRVVSYTNIIMYIIYT